MSVRDRLRAAGVRSPRDIICSDPLFLVDHAHVTLAEFEAVRAEEVGRLACEPLRGSELYDRALSRVVIFASACNGADSLLRGGVYTGEVTEIVGASGAGKTQLCLQMAAAAVALSPHTVYFIDTTGSFSAQRVRDILAGRLFGVAPGQIPETLQRIVVFSAFELPELLSLLESMSASLASTESGVKMLIVDSVAPIVAPALVPGPARNIANGAVAQVARTLLSIAVDHDIAVITTNHVAGGPLGPRAALGTSWSFASTTQLLVQRPDRARPSLRTFHVVKSSRLPQGTAETVHLDSHGYS